MYVCNCEGVTEREIRQAVRLGACSMRALETSLCVAQNCGKCAPEVRVILREERGSGAKHAASSARPTWMMQLSL